MTNTEHRTGDHRSTAPDFLVPRGTRVTRVMLDVAADEGSGMEGSMKGPT